MHREGQSYGDVRNVETADSQVREYRGPTGLPVPSTTSQEEETESYGKLENIEDQQAYQYQVLLVRKKRQKATVS